MLSHLLLMRLAIVTVAGCVLAIWAHANGLVTPIFAADVSRLSYAIIALFVAGLVSTFIRAAKVSNAINQHKAGRRRKAAKMEEKSSHIEAIAGWLVTLGLLGTVSGFALALSGIDLDALATAEGVQESAAHLMQGMQTAIGTTLVGGFLALWTEVNFVMLRTATRCYAEDVA